MCIAKPRFTIRLLIVLAVFYGSLAMANEFPDGQQAIAPGMGVALSDAQLDSRAKHIFPDGSGLPEGSGTAARGAPLYKEHCASCHGSEGQGGKALELVGDASLLATDYPDKGIAVYWPYAPTLYEYIDRSMPPETPGMFSVDELYSLIAHLLELNELIEAGSAFNQDSLANIEMPNKDGFVTIGR